MQAVVRPALLLALVSASPFEFEPDCSEDDVTCGNPTAERNLLQTNSKRTLWNYMWCGEQGHGWDCADVQLKPKSQPDKCMDSYGGFRWAMHYGNPIGLWPCKSGDAKNQKFRFLKKDSMFAVPDWLTGQNVANGITASWGYQGHDHGGFDDKLCVKAFTNHNHGLAPGTTIVLQKCDDLYEAQADRDTWTIYGDETTTGKSKINGQSLTIHTKGATGKIALRRPMEWGYNLCLDVNSDNMLALSWCVDATEWEFST